MAWGRNMEKIVIREKYSHYEFEILEYYNDEHPSTKHYVYNIHTNDSQWKFWMGTTIIRESDEYFDTEREAIAAAKDHIDALEYGER